MEEQFDMVTKLEQFKMGLISHATGGNIPDKEYKEMRKIILNVPSLKNKIPKFLKVCRSVGEFWQFIKSEYDTYAERRVFLSNELNPIIDYFESRKDYSNLDIDYELGECIGKGGFGQVFKYHHKLLDMDFAVKVFDPLFPLRVEEDVARFFQEAKILFELCHESIIKVFDIGILGNKPYIRMEYFQGMNLNEVLMSYGTLPIEKCTTLILDISKALSYAHKKVVHRDLKPSNIMVAKPNQFRIIDFGLGIYKEKEVQSRLTQNKEGVAGGLYTAPELYLDPLLIDKRSDIYSVGAIWYTMLLGRAPSGSRLKDNLLAIDDIDEVYASFIMRCLDDIEYRYNDLEELISDLENHQSSNK